jgi:hypothetical protein
MVTVLAGDGFAGSAAHRRTTSASSGGAGSGELGTRASGGDAFSTTGHYTRGGETRTMYDIAGSGLHPASARPQILFQNERGGGRHVAPSRAGRAVPAPLGKDQFHVIFPTRSGNVRRAVAFTVDDEVSTKFLLGPNDVLLRMAAGTNVRRGVDTRSGSGGSRSTVEVEEFS